MYNSTFVAVEDRLTEKYADLSLDDRKVVILHFTALSVKAIHNALANDADFALHVDAAKDEAHKAPKIARFKIPIFLDLIHNNARSKIVQSMIFALVVSFVALYFIIAVFGTTSSDNMTASFSKAPPSVATLGMPLTNFTVLVRNVFGRGLSGARLTATLTPASEIPLLGRSVDCIEHSLLPRDSPFSSDNDRLCNPVTYGYLLGTTSHSSSAGTASFFDLTLTYGGTVVYNLDVVVQYPGLPTVRIHTVVTLRSPVTAITQTTPLPSALTVGAPFVVTATVTITSSTNSSLTLHAAIMSLQLRGSDALLVPSLVIVSNTDKVIAAGLDDSMVSVSRVKGLPTQGMVIFPNVSVTSAMAPVAYFAVYCGGIMHILNEGSGNRKTLTLPVTIKKAHASLRAPFTTMSCPARLQENERTNGVQLLIQNGGLALAGKTAYATIRPSRLLPSPKRLINAVSTPTTVTGIASFSQMYFTTAGTVGVYTLDFIVDGVSLVSCDISVDTSINATASSVVFETPPWMNASTVVVLGETWVVTPRVFLAAKNVSRLVVGKTAMLVPSDPTKLQIASVAIPSNDFGWAMFTDVVATYAAFDGLHSVDVIADGMLIQTAKFVLSRNPLLNQTFDVLLTRFPSDGMVVGVAYRVEALVVSPFGVPVPLEPVVFSVASTSVTTFTHTATVPLTSSLEGTVSISDFTVTSLSADIGFLAVTVSTGAYKKTVVVSVARRALDVFHIQGSSRSFQTFEVLGSVSANWAYVSTTVPLVIGATLLRSPAYVTQHHPESDLPSISTASITNQIDGAINPSYGVTLRFGGYIPGVYVFVLECEGTTSRAFTVTVDALPSIQLTLSRSALLLSPLLITPTIPFLIQPAVKITANGGRTNVYNARVVAQLVVIHSPNNYTFLNPQNDSQDLPLGALGVTTDTALRPYSGLSSVTSGIATFGDLCVLGAVPGVKYGIYYSFAGAGTSTGVWDSGTFTLRSTQQISASVVAFPSIFAVPGMLLTRPFSVVVTYADLSPVMRTLGIAVIDKGGDAVPPLAAYLSVSASSYLSSGPLMFDAATPPGKYRMTMLIPGGQSGATSTVTLSRDAFSLEILTTFPTVGIIVGYSFSVVVQVRIADGAVLPLTNVVAEIRSTNESCLSTQCGVLSSDSSAISDLDGNARFTLTILHAQEGDYTLRFYTVGNGASVYDKLSGFSSAVDDVLHANTASYAQSASALGIDLPPFGYREEAAVATQSSLIATYATSAAITALQRKSQVDVTTSLLKVWNRVSQIIIDEDPRAGNTQAELARFAITGDFATLPTVRVLDRFGAPVQGKKVQVLVHPVEYALTIQYTSGDTTSMDITGVTDEDGTLEFLTFHLNSPTPAGTFYVMFLCEGMSNTSTVPFTIASISATFLVEKYVFEILSVVAFLTATPFFFSNFPTRSLWWSAVALGILLILPLYPGSREWILINISEGNNIFLRLHVIFMLFVWIFLLVGVMVVASSKMISQQFPALKEKYNKKRRTYLAVQYTRDIVCIRAPHQRKYKTEDVILYPMKFLIAIVVSVVVCIVMTYWSVYVVNYVVALLEDLRGKLPAPPPDLSPASRKRLTQELQTALTTGLSTIASMDERLAFFENVIPYVKDLDVFHIWETTFHVLDQMVKGVTLSGVIAIVCAVIVVLVNVIGLVLIVPAKYLRIRRGNMPQQFKDMSTIILADKYMGLQAMHFVLGHQMIFYLVFLVFLFLTTPYLVRTIVETFYYTVLVSLISVVVTLFVELIIVGRIVVLYRVVKYHRVYMFWAIWAMIISVANGVSLTIVRFIKAVFAITVFFARLDMDLFPEQLLFMDTGYWSFYSVLLVDEEYNNPISLTLTAALTAEWLMRQHIDPRGDSVDHYVPYPHMRHLIRCYLDEVGEESVLENIQRPAKSTRIVNRWRLTVLLMRNPTLQGLRKTKEKVPQGSAIGALFQKMKDDPSLYNFFSHHSNSLAVEEVVVGAEGREGADTGGAVEGPAVPPNVVVEKNV